MNHETNNEQTPGHRTLRVAAVQMESIAGDKTANFATMELFVEQAAQQDVKLIVFPECCITGYWFIRNLTPEALEQLAEPIFGGESSQRLIGLAQAIRDEHRRGIDRGRGAR